MRNAQTILVNEECSPMSRVKSYYFPLTVAWWTKFVLGIILYICLNAIYVQTFLLLLL